MEDSHQGNDKGNRKGKGVEKLYKVWTLEESNELLRLMVDAAIRGWRDSNGLLSKVTVERKILPTLNGKLGCQKTFAQYQSRLKWFKQRYNNYSEIMRHNSGFEWDHVTKKFTASDEVWEDYFKSHPTQRHYRTDTFADYEDLRIAIGNGTAVGRHSIALGDDTDARTFVAEERQGGGLEDLAFDTAAGAFIHNDQQVNEPLSSGHPNSPLPTQPIGSEIPPITRKRSRTEFEGPTRYSSVETNNTQSDTINKINQTVDMLTQTVNSIASRDQSCWKVLKEIPNLDNHTRFKALRLLTTSAKKMEFLEMTLEERISIFIMSHSDMHVDDEVEEEEIEEELDESIRYSLLAVIQTILDELNELIQIMHHECVQRPLTRRPIATRGYDYIHNILRDDPAHFRQVYRMYPDVFVKLCSIIREKTLLHDTRFICVEEMRATFLLIVGQNARYCLSRKTFSRSHYTTSRSFNKILKALNTIAVDMMVKPGSKLPNKYRQNTRFYPYFKDCIGAIDGTHIPAMVTGRDISSYRNRHGTISQNVLAACNFDLKFIYVLSGWEGSAHDSKVLSDTLSRRNGLKVPQDNEASSSPLGYQEDDFELFFETQEQQRENANEWRAIIARNMWDNVGDIDNNMD
ncbi:hypothetical protein ACOSQ3_031297 [Xanthoceras sorbifolium]